MGARLRKNQLEVMTSILFSYSPLINTSSYKLLIVLSVILTDNMENNIMDAKNSVVCTSNSTHTYTHRVREQVG